MVLAPAALALTLTLTQGTDAPDGAAPPPAIEDVRRALADKLAPLIAADGLARKDGYVYAIDVALLMQSAALDDDRTGYEHLLALTRRALLVERPPGLRAPVIIWRRRLQARLARPDASGTTETLQIAHALLLGAAVFDRRADRRLAERLLDGYVAHATTLDGVWLVRNYYNLGTRDFATNSYLIDHAPDLLMHVAGADKTGVLAQTAARSAALVRQAARRNGLIDLLVQPELKTLYPFFIHSPNDVIELEHSALVAEEVVKTAPEVARALLEFARTRLDDLRAAYLGRTGEPYGTEKADAGTLAAIARLAVKLGSTEVVSRVRGPLAWHADTLVRRPETFDVHVAAQTLLGLHFIARADQGKRPPLAAAD